MIAAIREETKDNENRLPTGNDTDGGNNDVDNGDTPADNDTPPMS
jgi:hypothetical protein